MYPQNPLPIPLTTLPKLSLGCPILDNLLHGGVPINTLTELVAESGLGKTQLCLQLLFTTQYPPLSGAAVYLHSELPFPFRRLHQLVLQHPSLQNPLGNVFIEPLYDAHQLFDKMSKLEFMLSRGGVVSSRLPVKVVVIDSIAALFRSEYGNNREDLMTRSKMFFEISSRLKAMAVKYGVAVVVTNQVVDVMDSDGVGNSECLVSSGRRVSPALGLSWTHCVNVRLFLYRQYERVVGEGESVEFETRRFIRVVFAPHLPDSSCEFVIKREGVTGIDQHKMIQEKCEIVHNAGTLLRALKP
ncbi:hypothetical protein Leryth_015386 [Lithospermum erythrorhizon]|nr:hypothetical protein Leryth_015386 [Lithospermum erythrorhizon]